MSALAGVWAVGNAPVPTELLARISRALERMGPDGETTAEFPSGRMVFRPFHTDAASRRSPGPLASDGYLLAFGGRLDNAAEVRRTLRYAVPHASDAELVLATYRAAGIEGFASLVGDFALSLWDPTRKQLLLACDALGRRALYYHRNAEHLFWASECRPLLQAVGRVSLDDEFVADYLANRVSVGHSPFQGIHAVPAGHVLVVDDGADARLVRYWQFDPGYRVTYRTDAEYAEHFSSLFREAVACRMRADGPVVCELSGGLDSSSIACTADALVRGGHVEAPSIRTVSHVYRTSATSDETPYIEQVERLLGQRGEWVLDDEWPLLQPLPKGLRPDLPSGRLASAAAEGRVDTLMKGWGSRVLLCGIGGDQLFWSQPYVGLPLADHLVRGQLVELFRAGVAWSRWQGHALPGVLWAGAVKPLLPRAWQLRVEPEERMGEWIDSEFARRTQLPARMLPGVDDVGFHLPSTSRQYGLICPSLRPFALERSASERYVDVRYPYLDRRLVEFALAIPLDQKVRPGETRSVVRRGLVGIVPEAIRTRVSKSGPSEALQRALIREWPRVSPWLSAPLVAEHGYVDGDAFRTTLDRARHGLTTHASQLRKTLSLEMWLRTLHELPSTPPARLRTRSPNKQLAVHVS
jgi:asparagine synthase (glutamine-hydrolysing)